MGVWRGVWHGVSMVSRVRQREGHCGGERDGVGRRSPHVDKSMNMKSMKVDDACKVKLRYCDWSKEELK